MSQYTPPGLVRQKIQCSKNQIVTVRVDNNSQYHFHAQYISH